MVQFFPNESPPRFHAFDVPDGLQGLEFNSHGFLRRSNGEFWFAGQNGVNYFNPSNVRLLQRLPQVQFTQLYINDNEAVRPCALTGATNISEVKRLDFTWRENTLSFEFAALEFSNPSKNTFQYMMQGYDENWVQGGTRGFARYANLPPKTYTFSVRAANSDGLFSAPKNITIVIAPPWWRQSWFILLALTFLLTTGHSIYRWRIGQLLGVERLRNQISIDLHDDIGATLSNVNILTTLIRQKLPADSEALPLLDRIEEEVQASAESLDDIIWSINPKNDPLDRVLARMRRFATEVFEAKGIEGTLQFPPEAKRLRLTMEKRRHFYLFFKEAINNLTKYSNCRNAVVSVIYQKGQLTVSISDDGVGFDLNTAKEGGNGLMTMRQRAKNLRGEFSLKSAPGQGTTVGIRFPVTENRD
jgi:two-component sensor histidine kinase